MSVLILLLLFFLYNWKYKVELPKCLDFKYGFDYVHTD